jgi:hypothetical protein
LTDFQIEIHACGMLDLNLKRPGHGAETGHLHPYAIRSGHESRKGIHAGLVGRPDA